MIDPWQAKSSYETNCLVAEHVFGWKWWAYTKQVRQQYGDPFHTVLVRGLWAPDANLKLWHDWAAAKERNVFRPAAGTEPIGGGGIIPQFLSSADADYEVLLEVRRQHFNCVNIDTKKFAEELHRRWKRRSNTGLRGLLPSGLYVVGDYSRAALACVLRSVEHRDSK